MDNIQPICSSTFISPPSYDGTLLVTWQRMIALADAANHLVTI